MGVTYPRGFRAAGIAAGLKPSGKLDLALLVGDGGTSAAGVFTTNAVVAAPVELSRKHLAAGGGRGVIVNSGQANAATGARGDADAEAVAAATASMLGLEPTDLLACSTGVIGEPLHMEPLLGALPVLVASLSTKGGDRFAEAIMTTDTVPKTAISQAGSHRVGGAAKGVGMISPNLATMLAFVTTDARLSASDLQVLVRERLAPRFNELTVDGCTSTNDSVVLLASGAASPEPVIPGTTDWRTLADAVEAVGTSLATQLIHDGEGATHVLIVEVAGAATDRDARHLADAVADSLLVKTASFGEDPNPGRILQALGASGVAVDPDRIDVSIDDVSLAVGGVIPPAYFADPALRTAAVEAMRAPEVRIRIGVGTGPGAARALGCDLSYEYVRINGEYTT